MLARLGIESRAKWLQDVCKVDQNTQERPTMQEKKDKEQS